MKDVAIGYTHETPAHDAGEIAIDPALPCEPVRLLTAEEIAEVARLRGAVSILTLPEPSDIVGPWKVRGSRERSASSRWAGAALASEHGSVTNVAATTDRADDEDALDAAHDRYFRMERARGAASARGLAATLRTSLGILAFEFRNEAVSPGYDAIELAIGSALARLGETVAVEGAPVDAARAVEPFGRWIRGHQIFAVLTQGLIGAFLSLEAAMAEPGERSGDDAPAALDLIAALLAASAASLRLTGAFDPDAYQRLVRPSMAPPHVPHGFSGLLSEDHRYLVQTMMRLRSCLAVCETRFRSAHAGMRAALAAVYDTHKHVCARFAGESTPSLRMKAASVRSGVEQLDNFKRARLRLVSQRARPTE